MADDAPAGRVSSASFDTAHGLVLLAFGASHHDHHHPARTILSVCATTCTSGIRVSHLSGERKTTETRTPRNGKLQLAYQTRTSSKTSAIRIPIKPR